MQYSAVQCSISKVECEASSDHKGLRPAAFKHPGLLDIHDSQSTLHCAVLYSTLHYTALCCTLHYTTLHSTLHFTTLHCTVLYSTSLHYITILSIGLYYCSNNTLLKTVMYFTTIHINPLYCTSLPTLQH